MRSVIIYIALYLSLIPAGALFAQAGNLLLNRLSTPEGLSCNDVKCIYQDSKGFVWIGTYDGLNRYDGRNVKIYRRNVLDSNSLINNWVTSLTEDDAGNLWIGTAGGVSRLNASDGRFLNFYEADLFANHPCTAGEQKVFKDNKGVIWVCSGGLSYFNKQAGRFVAMPFIPPCAVHGYTINQLVLSVTVDKKNNFWMGTADGLYRYNGATNLYDRFNTDTTNEFYVKHGNNLGSVNILNDSVIVFCAWANNMYTLKTTAGNFDIKTALTLGTGAEMRVFTIKWNGQKEFWVTHSGGIVRLDTNFNIIEQWPTTNQQNTATISLTGGVKTVFQSREDITFIGTSEGIIIINPYLQLFGTHYFTNSGNAGNIACIEFAGNKVLAGSMYSNGLYIMDSTLRATYTIPSFSPVSATEATSNTHGSVNDGDGFIWFATFQGLIKLNPHNLQYTIYRPPATDSLFYRHKRFYVVQSTGSKLWLVNYKQDAFCFDKKTATFKLLKLFAPQRNIWGVIPAYGYVWFGSGNILARYNDTDGTVKYIKNSKAPDAEYDNFARGKNNELWLSSLGGLWRYNVQTNEWANWNTADGLCNDYIDKLIFDQNGRLWITTFNGISAFDTAKKVFYNFNSSNGLPRNTWQGAVGMSSKGILYLGNDNLITFFDPSKVVRADPGYPAFITGCQVNGSNYPLPGQAGGARSISLTYRQNNLAFQFTVLNLVQPFQTSYYYKLEGFDTAWHLSPNGAINYTNLYAGTYTLRVSSAPANNTPGSDALVIVINSPIWARWWFITAVILFAALAATYALRRRIYVIRQEANRKAAISQQFADLRMKALRSQMNPHFLFNSLNAIQECCITGQTDMATQYLAKFSKLVRYILENSGKQWISLKEEMETLRLYLEVESLRFTSSFNYYIQNNVQVNESLIKIPPMLVQPFAENAIWHGLLHKNGERHVWIRFYNDEEKLYIEVEDDGVGRDANKKQNHVPMGMGIVEERVRLIEETQQSAARIEIIDKKDAAGSALGTIVKLKLPLL